MLRPTILRFAPLAARLVSVAFFRILFVLLVTGTAVKQHFSGSWQSDVSLSVPERSEAVSCTSLRRRHRINHHWVSSCRTRRVRFHDRRVSFLKPQPWVRKGALAPRQEQQQGISDVIPQLWEHIKTEIQSWASLDESEPTSSSYENPSEFMDNGSTSSTESEDLESRTIAYHTLERPSSRFSFRDDDSEEEEEEDVHADESYGKMANADIGREFALLPSDTSCIDSENRWDSWAEEVEEMEQHRLHPQSRQRRDAMSRAQRLEEVSNGANEEAFPEQSGLDYFADTCSSEEFETSCRTDPYCKEGQEAIAWIKKWMRFPEQYDAWKVLCWFVVNRDILYFTPTYVPTRRQFYDRGVQSEGQYHQEEMSLRSTPTMCSYNDGLRVWLNSIDWEVCLRQLSLTDEQRGSVDDFLELVNTNVTPNHVVTYYGSCNPRRDRNNLANRPSRLRNVVVVEGLYIKTAGEVGREMTDLWQSMVGRLDRLSEHMNNFWFKTQPLDELSDDVNGECEAIRRRLWGAEDEFEAFDNRIAAMMHRVHG
jgi:hypothetical protein